MRRRRAMNRTSIPWADFSWNPTTGCTFGCEWCYARKVAERFGDKRHAAQWLEDVADFGPCFYAEADNPEASSVFPVGFAPTAYIHRLDEPLRRKKPAVIFLGSMGDVSDPAIPDSFRFQVLDTVRAASWHTCVLLTKRAKEQAEWIRRYYADRGCDVLPNLVIGVSATNQADADERIPLLLDTPAAKRMVSVEPMLGPVDLSRHWLGACNCYDAGYPDHQVLDFVAVGGKTPGAPLHEPMRGWRHATGWYPTIDALRSLRDQCAAAGVPFHYKHGGTNPTLDGVVYDAEVPR